MSEKVNYKVKDNFLPKENFIKIKDILLGMDFPWYYCPNISNKNIVSKGPLFYLTHLIYDRKKPNSDFYDVIKENLLDFVDMKAIVRIKANLYPNQGIKKINEPHVDFDYKHKGAIFSLNTNNGGTVLEDGTIIKSIENRILFFDPSTKHDSLNCTDEKIRVNINMNYF